MNAAKQLTSHFSCLPYANVLPLKPGKKKVIFPSPLGDMHAPSRFVMQALIEAEDKYELQKDIKVSKQS